MSASVALRPVQPGDLEFLFRVYASTREEELSVVAWTIAERESFLRQQFMAQDRHYRQIFPEARFDIISVSGTDIGRLYSVRQPDELRVIDISLLPAWRGKGIGSQLLRELLTEAAAACQRVTIHVEKHNPALRLYHRLGFKPVSDAGIYWLMTWTVSASG